MIVGRYRRYYWAPIRRSYRIVRICTYHGYNHVKLARVVSGRRTGADISVRLTPSMAFRHRQLPYNNLTELDALIDVSGAHRCAMPEPTEKERTFAGALPQTTQSSAYLHDLCFKASGVAQHLAAHYEASHGYVACYQNALWSC